MKFEWDEAKAASNLEKHGVSFGDAARIFDDLLRLEEPDRSVKRRAALDYDRLGTESNPLCSIHAKKRKSAHHLRTKSKSQ